MSHFWSALVKSLQCEKSVSSRFHPETDGQSERFHRSVEQILRCYVSPHQRDWDVYLPFAEFSLNSTKSASTKYSPFFVLYGREPTLPVDLAVRAVTDCKVEAVT